MTRMSSVSIQHHEPVDTLDTRSLSRDSMSRTGPFTLRSFSYVARVLYVGGYSNNNVSNAPNYGLSYVNANNDLSNNNSNIGGRLTKLSIINDFTVIRTSPQCEISEKHQAGLVPIWGTSGPREEGTIMPKRIGNLMERIIDPANIEAAAKETCSVRRNKVEVARFMVNREQNLQDVRKSLIDNTYKTSGFYFFKRKEHGKVRDIADLPLYPHRIVRQAFARVIEPLLNKKLIDHTHASVKGRGTHSALVQARDMIREHPKLRYCLSMDIHHCYASIDPVRLKIAMGRLIKDPWVMSYLYEFIDAYNETGNPGISIGDRLSPIFCNCYLSRIDHHAREDLKYHTYIRYADNIFVFGNSRKWLLQVEKELESLINDVGLKLNSNWHIADLTKEGVDFLGYRLYHDYILIRKKTKVRMKREMKALLKKLESGQFPDNHDLGMFYSYKGLLQWCNSYHLYRETMYPVERRINEYLGFRDGCKAFREFMEQNKELF